MSDTINDGHLDLAGAWTHRRGASEARSLMPCRRTWCSSFQLTKRLADEFAEFVQGRRTRPICGGSLNTLLRQYRSACPEGSELAVQNSPFYADRQALCWELPFTKGGRSHARKLSSAAFLGSCNSAEMGKILAGKSREKL
jgi:hypothetical protein